MWFAVVGPTAVGKTELAFWVAEQLVAEGKIKAVDIISADSRQVYQGLRIVSGVDIPPSFHLEKNSEWPVFVNQAGAIRLWGLEMVRPDQEWSVAHFQDFIRPLLEKAELEDRLCIVVGGAGLYHQQLTQTDPSLHIGPNLEVREQAENLTVFELQLWLQKVDAYKWSQMNDSDRANPRRLVRSIELGLAKGVSKPVTKKEVPTSPLPSPSLTVGLQDALPAIEQRIHDRVVERLAAGAATEVSRLEAEYPNQKLPMYTATGVKILRALQTGELDEVTATQKWVTQERQYAKRQITWFKKQLNITWFSIDQTNYRSQILEAIHAWWPR